MAEDGSVYPEDGAVTPRNPPSAAETPAAPRPARADRYYATRLRQLAHLELDEQEAEELWRKVARHRRDMLRLLGRDVGLRVALLDYIVNIHPQLVEPKIIEKAALEAMEQQAIADPLTGLYNRRYFESELSRETERCRRYGASSSLMLLDLDQFKEINDGYGHKVGDEVLKAVGGLILNNVRAADVPCRYGGDEFAVILPDTPQSEALRVAERIRADVASAFEQYAAYGELTVSAGVAMMTADTTSPDQLFKEADRSLYVAKGAGGNRVVGAASAPAQSRPARGS